MSARGFVSAIAVALAAAGAATAGAPSAAARTAERPTIVVAANVATGGTTRPGWPIVVSAVLVPGADTTGAPMAPPAAPALAPRLVDARGTAVALALARIPTVVNEEGVTAWAWVANEAATRGLAPGTYRVTTDTTGLTRTFRFAIGALVVEPASATADRRTSILRIESEAIAGRYDAALAEADRLIAADSSDVSAWATRGDLFMAKDAPGLALGAYGQALARRDPKDEAIDLQRRNRDAFRRFLEQRGTKSAPAPAGGK